MFSKSNPLTGAPDAQDMLHFTEDFGRRFLITVDTEEEFDWDGPFERSGHTTISVPKLERFQDFISKYGVKPVYFIDYSIVKDEAAVAFLKSTIAIDSATIGVHLHPWINPPFDEKVNEYNSFAGNLSEEIEEKKIVNLKQAIEQNTNYSPTIYRAGRYGVGPNTIKILSKHGFTIDSSVRSRFDYSEEGGPDFSHLGSEPFWLNAEKSLLELPLTTVFSGMLRKQGEALAGTAQKSELVGAFLSKTKMLERIPLTPEGISVREAKEAIDVALDDNVKLLVFSFHSPSLSPGHTPYVKTSADLDAFYDWWREIITYLESRNVSATSVDQILAQAGLKTE